MKNRKMLSAASLLALFLLGGVAECVARFVLGLGDPPLSIADAEIDYLFAPNQDCRRFGHRVVYNNVSMRSGRDLAAGGPAAGRRVMLVGDSVVNGGVLTDQRDLASSLLDAEMAAKGLGECFNVSAGSWGPMNYAAYFKKYGTFGATDLILEVNSHDLWEDDPEETAGRNVGSDISLPDRKPWCALWEGFHRYFWPRVRRKTGAAAVNNKVDVARWGTSLDEPAVKRNLAACAYLYSLPFKRKMLVVHRSRAEWRGGGIPLGEKPFREQAEALGVEVALLALDAEADYRDAIHMNASGQRKLFRLLADRLGVASAKGREGPGRGGISPAE